jgi:hypothetical protein
MTKEELIRIVIKKVELITLAENGFMPNFLKTIDIRFKNNCWDNFLSFHNNKGKPHSFKDFPAIIRSSRIKEWYKNGKLHRDGDKPARIWPDGRKECWKSGKYIKNL